MAEGNTSIIGLPVDGQRVSKAWAGGGTHLT